MSSPIYCGNNRNHSSLKKGKQKIGTRHSCLKKGVAIGLSLPYDPEYENSYSPIDKRKTWCGKNNKIPKGYHILGNNPLCLQKGISLGKIQKVKKSRSKSKRKSKRKSR
jgi:hypothetical protein